MKTRIWTTHSIRASFPFVLGALAACSSSDSGASASGQDGAGGAGFDGGPGSGGAALPFGSGGQTSAPAPVTCGDGVVQAPESCDGAALNGQTCGSATMNALPLGAVRCASNCTLDVSGCTGAAGSGGATGTGGALGTGAVTNIGGGPDVGGSPGIGGGVTIGGCGQALPAVTDYEKDGPFGSTMVEGTGPGGAFTMYKPARLGEGGFKHPPLTWGNGITTTPRYYDVLLNTIASHGFVVIASNSSNVTAGLMTQGLDWLVTQNSTPGEFQGVLDTKCLLTVGYSLGGGAAVGAGSHADVVATVSMHGVTGNSGALHAPLFLLTSETDTFVTPAGFVTPTYNASSVQTFYATLSKAGDPSNFGHIIPVNSAGPERAPVVAWLRLWAYGDPGAQSFFYGDDCVLCKAPWTNPQRKNWK